MYVYYVYVCLCVGGNLHCSLYNDKNFEPFTNKNYVKINFLSNFHFLTATICCTLTLVCSTLVIVKKHMHQIAIISIQIVFAIYSCPSVGATDNFALSLYFLIYLYYLETSYVYKP